MLDNGFCWDLVRISLLIVAIKTESSCGNILISEESVSYPQWHMWSKKGESRCPSEEGGFSPRFWLCFAGFLGENQGHFTLVLLEVVPDH